jgi:pimeloyl-ACP methyl ester carboxylesterase
VIAVNRWRNAPPPDWWELASKIQAKTLVLGAADSSLRQSRVEELSRRIPNATFATMNSTHDGHEERPSEFLIPVQPFISWFAKH